MSQELTVNAWAHTWRRNEQGNTMLMEPVPQQPLTRFGQEIRCEPTSWSRDMQSAIKANLAFALAVARADTPVQKQGTINAELQCSREGTTGKLRGHAISVMHSCTHGIANAFWLVVYTGKGRFWHIDARRAFNQPDWYGAALHGSEQRRRFMRDLNDRFESIQQFAEWCVSEDMPRIRQDLNQSPIEDPATLETKGIDQWTL